MDANGLRTRALQISIEVSMCWMVDARGLEPWTRRLRATCYKLKMLWLFSNCTLSGVTVLVIEACPRKCWSRRVSIPPTAYS